MLTVKEKIELQKLAEKKLGIGVEVEYDDYCIAVGFYGEKQIIFTIKQACLDYLLS